MAFLHRSGRGPDRHLPLKNLAFAIGASLALAGIALDSRWLVTAAIALLAVALIGARIARPRHPPDE